MGLGPVVHPIPTPSQHSHSQRADLEVAEIMMKFSIQYLREQSRSLRQLFSLVLTPVL